MKQPIKMKNAVRSLIKDACGFTRLSPQAFMQMYEWARGHGQPRKLFAATCAYLESNEDNVWINDPKYQLPYKLNMEDDQRFGMLFDLMNVFLTLDAAQFWARDSEHEFVIDEPETEDTTVLFGSAGVKKEIKYFDRPTIPWNEDQSKAFKQIFNWYRAKHRPPIFRLFGFAGTGKTEMIKEIAWCIQNAEGVPKGEVLFASYTGKAAAVMMSKGCTGASTLHSMIYKPRVDRVTGKVKEFALNPESPLRHASLLVVDEVSMVNDDMAMDILSYGVPILVVGDPFQIKPIKGEGYFIKATPDVLLTKIERQAAENPIIWLSMQLRAKKKIKPGSYGDTNVYAYGTRVQDEHVFSADQILVGTHKTRQSLIRRYRTLHGYFDIDTEFPTKGERLLCTKNNKSNGLLNGTQWHCSRPKIKPIKKLKDPKRPALGYEVTRLQGLNFKVRSMDLFNSEGNPLILDTVCSMHHFDQNLPEPPWQDIAGTDAWTFAAAMTIHKAQGSQFDRTLIVDESDVFEDQRWEHFYTALTRTAKSGEIYL
jgi:exodeoxyribonuclease-5